MSSNKDSKAIKKGENNLSGNHAVLNIPGEQRALLHGGCSRGRGVSKACWISAQFFTGKQGKLTLSSRLQTQNFEKVADFLIPAYSVFVIPKASGDSWHKQK